MARRRASASATPRARCGRSGFNVVLISQWNDPRDTDACTAWCRETYAALQPFLGTTRYVNYTDDRDEASDIVSTVYGPNYARLRELKTKYDPRELLPHEREHPAVVIDLCLPHRLRSVRPCGAEAGTGG